MSDTGTKSTLHSDVDLNKAVNVTSDTESDVDNHPNGKEEADDGDVSVSPLRAVASVYVPAPRPVVTGLTDGCNGGASSAVSVELLTTLSRPNLTRTVVGWPDGGLNKVKGTRAGWGYTLCEVVMCNGSEVMALLQDGAGPIVERDDPEWLLKYYLGATDQSSGQAELCGQGRKISHHFMMWVPAQCTALHCVVAQCCTWAL
jgi:hypothetical protein